MKLAVTARSDPTVTVHVVPETESHPLQPLKRERRSGAAVNVTVVPETKRAEQVPPQLIPAGFDVTVPSPRSKFDFCTVSVNCGMLNVARTVREAVRLTVHVVPETASHPDQPANTEPDAAAAVSVTCVPFVNDAAHVLPQLMPAGLDVTVPLPVPGFCTVSVDCCWLNVACTVRDVFIVTLHVVPDTASHPDQPANTEPDAAAAVNVTCVPLVNEAEHTVPQSMAAGFDVTDPLPSPCRETESVADVSVTLSTVLPLAPVLSVAVMVVVPRLSPWARPLASMVAIEVSLLVHVTELVPIPLILTAVGASAVP
jgi:hypothetical protein